MKKESSRPDPQAVPRHPDEEAVQEAVHAVQEDIQALLHQHFEDVRQVLPQLVRSSLERLEQEARSSSAKQQRTPEWKPQSVGLRERISQWRDWWSQRRPVVRYGVTLAAVAVVAFAATRFYIGNEGDFEQAPISTLVAPAQPVANDSQQERTSDVIAIIRAKRYEWDRQYRNGRVGREIKLLFSEATDRSGRTQYTIGDPVRESAGRYEKGPLSTTLQDETRLAIALIQAFLVRDDSGQFAVDGALSWKEVDKPEGQSAPLLQRYLIETYLPTLRVTLDDLVRENSSDFPELLASIERALLVDRVLGAGR